uniref:Uncharacterized protein n=1 Tax=Anguilla anguilla TaxID=7936 RepID=A0A0E9QB83_ANGAN
MGIILNQGVGNPKSNASHLLCSSP